MLSIFESQFYRMEAIQNSKTEIVSVAFGCDLIRSLVGEFISGDVAATKIARWYRARKTPGELLVFPTGNEHDDNMMIIEKKAKKSDYLRHFNKEFEFDYLVGRYLDRVLDYMYQSILTPLDFAMDTKDPCHNLYWDEHYAMCEGYADGLRSRMTKKSEILRWYRENLTYYQMAFK